MHLRIDRVQRRKRSKNRYSLRKRGVLESLLPIFEDFPSKEKSGDSRWSRKRKRCVREICPAKGARKGKAKGEKNERRGMDKRWTSFTHRRRTYLDEDGGTKTVLRCLSRQTRFKLAEFEIIPELGFARNSSFDFRNRFRFFFSRIEFFLILSPISFDPTIASCFQTCFERQVVREKGEFK